jgi:hypothetical protein
MQMGNREIKDKRRERTDLVDKAKNQGFRGC